MRNLMAMVVMGLVSVTANAEEHQHDFAPDVKAMHAVLSPLWHAEAGAKRQKETCAALPNMLSMATKMHYKTAAQLADAGSNLQKLCSADQKTFNASFSQFHDAFHRVMEEK